MFGPPPLGQGYLHRKIVEYHVEEEEEDTLIVNTKSGQNTEKSKSGSTITKRVFDQEKAFKKSKSPYVNQAANEDWTNNKKTSYKQLPVSQDSVSQTFDRRGPLAVPFFPSHW